MKHFIIIGEYCYDNLGEIESALDNIKRLSGLPAIEYRIDEVSIEEAFKVRALLDNTIYIKEGTVDKSTKQF